MSGLCEIEEELATNSGGARAFRKKMFLETSIEYAMCIGGEEDSSYLLFECPFAQVVWVAVMLAETFQESLMGGAYRKWV